MTRFTRLVAPLALAATLTLGACSGDADVDIQTDTTATSDSMNYTPADSGMPSNAGADTVGSADSARGVNSDADSMPGAAGSTGTGTAAGGASSAANGDLETLVEAQLMVSPGFSDVRVGSEGDAVIVLDGTVASAEEKANAETEAKKIVGVKSVKNNLTVK